MPGLIGHLIVLIKHRCLTGQYSVCYFLGQAYHCICKLMPYVSSSYYESGGISGRTGKKKSVKSKFSAYNFKKIRIPQFSETRFGSFVGLFSCFYVYKQ